MQSHLKLALSAAKQRQHQPLCINAAEWTCILNIIYMLMRKKYVPEAQVIIIQYRNCQYFSYKKYIYTSTLNLL
jgi:hypothetical protein